MVDLRFILEGIGMAIDDTNMHAIDLIAYHKSSLIAAASPSPEIFEGL